MSDVRLDLSGLHDLYKDLLLTSISFGDIQVVSERVQGAVGHDGLSHRVGEFASKWDDRRKEIVESLDALSAVVRSIQETFVEVDDALASHLTNEG